eukprot:COSAG06_NODE_477_length_15216_cov_133.572402_7_plen_109_part_00
MIILPRHARDKHREDSLQGLFLQGASQVRRLILSAAAPLQHRRSQRWSVKARSGLAALTQPQRVMIIRGGFVTARRPDRRSLSTPPPHKEERWQKVVVRLGCLHCGGC